MHGIAFLQDLAVVMIVAGLVTIVFHRLKQPVVLGYILAGVIIGPHTPPFPLIHSEETIHTLAELGIIFLMFSLGLEFSLRKLKQVGLTAAIAAALEIVLMLGVGYEIGRLFGWSTMDSLFLGGILSISSTTIIIKAFGDLGKTKEKFSQLVFGILIVEDILGIALIALLSGIATSGSLSAADLLATLGKLGLFLTAALVVGLLTVPRLLGFVAKFKSNEMLLITVLGLCFGVCLLVAHLGYSVALGAFLIGAIVAEARQIGLIERLTEPIRDMFSAVFFVAIGLLIDPKVIWAYAVPILVITLAVVVGKVVTCSFGTFVAGHDTRTSLRVGMSLAQIGEFSFIIATLGLTLKATSPFLYPIAVAVSAITTLLTPYLIRSSDRIVSWFTRVGPKPVLGYLDVYTRWVGGLGTQKPTSQATHFIRRWSWQMALNTVLIIALFAAAAVIAQQSPAWLPQWLADQEHMNAVLWLAATILSLPLFIATFRKLQALGLLIADLGGSRDPAASGSRTVITQLVPLAGIIMLGVLVLVLSAAILPPMNVLIVLALLVGLITFLLWRAFIRLYSKAQIALTETLAQSRAEPNAPAVSDLLAEAKLTPVVIAPGSPGAGKLISELQLRTRTGASIVAIQRDGVKIINPGPEEELLAGDKLLLLASAAHMNKAIELLRPPS